MFRLRFAASGGLAAMAVVAASLVFGVAPGMADTKPAASTPAVTSAFTGTPLAEQLSAVNGAPLALKPATSSGSTHCFFAISAELGPHYGCQFNHSTSNKILSAAESGGLGTASLLICAPATGPFAIVCGAAGVIVSTIISVLFPAQLAEGRCLEVGVSSFFGPYAYSIACSIE